MKKKLFILTLAGSLFFSMIITSCVKDEGKAPAPATPVIPASACDTITYTKHVKQIIDVTCAIDGCHGGTTSNPLLTSYDQVKDRADADRIRIRAIDANQSPMPPAGNPALTAAQKDLITCWLNNGKKQ